FPGWASRVGARRDVGGAEVVAQLERSVLKRLMSDVPMGVLLSGGLDSSIVAALARPHLGSTKSFAVGVEGSPDLDDARLAARAIGTDHRERTYSADDVRRDLTKIIYHLESYDAALVRSALPCFWVSELAAEHVKVVLTGEGADEVFGGYAHHGDIANPAAFHRECSRLLLGLHAMNLQRVDRMTMAHGLEGRVPFLDVEFVDFAMSIAPELKLQQAGMVEKQLLRAGASELLPAEIARRRKLEFADGSGATQLLSSYAEAEVTDGDLARAASHFPSDPPKTKEELLYRRTFAELFPGDAARRTVQRWRPDPTTDGERMNGATDGTR
ncbi:MAG TPA: asparagine synthase-related protein, partial [Polyangiaceae bacterium]|nr:asparagine synthase-related protein [Polyangiaceae bacterium]